MLQHVATVVAVAVINFVVVFNDTTFAVASDAAVAVISVCLLCFFCLVFVMPLCASVYLCVVVTCWERADL